MCAKRAQSLRDDPPGCTKRKLVYGFYLAQTSDMKTEIQDLPNIHTNFLIIEKKKEKKKNEKILFYIPENFFH